MNTMCTLLGVCPAALITLARPAAGKMESTSYRLPAHVFDGGGSKSSSAGFRLTGAIGQATPTGVSQSNVFRSKAGFIPQITGKEYSVNSCTITFHFVDQGGDLIGTSNERVYVNGFGWKGDGEKITVEPGTSISYRAYYRENCSLCGPWLSHFCTATVTIPVYYHTLTLDFEDQAGDLDPANSRGTGNEAVYIDQVGYRADDEMIAVPFHSTISFSACFKQGSSLSGPRNSFPVNGTSSDLPVSYQTLTLDFKDQIGDLNPANSRGTGNERAYIDYVGYKADDESITLPLGSTINYRAYFAQDSVLYGPKNPLYIESSSDSLLVRYHTITMNFVDQIGDLDPANSRGTGNERVYIDYVGYKADEEALILPLGSTIRYRACFKPASGLYGPKYPASIDDSWNILTAQYRTLHFDVIDSVSHNPVPGAQLYVDNAGYVQNGGFLTAHLSGTIYHRANVGSTWSAKTGKTIDYSWSGCTCQWNGVAFGSPEYL